MADSEKEKAPKRGPGVHEVLIGTVSRFLMRADNGFAIGDLRLENGGFIRFVGKNLSALYEGQKVKMSGVWFEHEVYGLELSVREVEQDDSDDKGVLVNFFSSERFPGVGAKTALKIVESLGQDAPKIILNDPDVLVEKCEVPPRLAQTIHTALDAEQSHLNTLLQFLEWKIPQEQIDLLLHKDIDRDMLKEDCFMPYFRFSSFTWPAAMNIADGIGEPRNSIRRVEAFIYRALRELCFQRGSTYLTREQLQKVCRYQPDFDQGLEKLIARGNAIKEGDRIYLRSLWTSEKNIASMLHRMMERCKSSSSRRAADPERVEQAISRLEMLEHIEYDEIQKKAIRTFFEEPFMLLCGGPGTGKTTIVRAILGALSRLVPYSNIALCAPTGRAAKRLSELSGMNARTIHSMLGWKPETNTFEKDSSNRLNLDFLIIDEFSMVDTHLFDGLLQAINPDCRILIIGDDEQLESVGEGKVLADLLESRQFAAVRLEHLYRQKEGSAIAVLADEIRHAKPLEYNSPVSMVVPQKNMTSQIREIVMNLDNPASIQLLAPKYEGNGGIFELNEMMQAELNPFHPAKAQITTSVKLKDGPKHTLFYRVGDKVMLKINVSDLDIYNGDIGEIVEVDQARKTLLVQFDEVEFEVSGDIYGALAHAWCTSVHKAQGSEYQNVLFSIPPDAYSMCTRRLIYTAVSRAKKALWIVADRSRFETRAKGARAWKRQTSLKERLISSSPERADQAVPAVPADEPSALPDSSDLSAQV